MRLLETVVVAEPRASRGKNEARRTRKSGLIPAIVYGAFKDPQAVSVSPKEILRIIRGKSGHNAIFDVDIRGVERTPVIVADEQYEPVKGTLMHIDLKRIDLTRKLRVAVPVHTTGDVKASSSRVAYSTSLPAALKSNASLTIFRTSSMSTSPN